MVDHRHDGDAQARALGEDAEHREETHDVLERAARWHVAPAVSGAFRFGHVVWAADQRCRGDAETSFHLSSSPVADVAIFQLVLQLVLSSTVWM